MKVWEHEINWKISVLLFFADTVKVTDWKEYLWGFNKEFTKEKGLKIKTC